MTELATRAAAHVEEAIAQARVIPELPDDVALRPVAKVGIVGAGTMGGGIAMSFVNAGFQVHLVDATQDALDRGLGAVRRSYEGSVTKGRLTRDEAEARMNRLTGTLDYADLSSSDLVIEAVFEDMSLKQDVWSRLGAFLKPGAIMATNTSTLDVDVLAEASGRPGDFVGLHFFSPAHIMRLLEVVKGRETNPDVLATVVDLASRIGKTPVVSGVCYGFIGNRMAEVYMRETEFLIMEGASPAQIDGAVQALGMAMGPCRMLDMAGVDVGAKTVIEWKKSGGAPDDPRYRVIVDELFRVGRHGQKTGAGYYRYEERDPIPDPEFDRLARAVAEKHQVPRRDDIWDQEIVERLLYSMINEGCRILEEGISYRPGDIDVVWVAGYGFPKALGGPMYWAEHTGLDEIVKRLEHYGRVCDNEYWTPSALLRQAAEEDRSLSEVLGDHAVR